MLDSLFEGIAQLLNFFYELIPNYAVAIALLTCVVMLVTTPLTLKSTRSMISMQRLQPEIRKLQVQYKDDRQKLNEEMMKFYRENEINPVGGCLPMLIQLPVFSVLYWVVQGLTNNYKFTGVQQYLADQGLISPENVFHGFRPKYLDHSSALYQSLLGSDHMNAFGVDLARSASTALSDSFVEALPYFALVGIIAFLSWVQQRQIMGRNPNGEVTSQQRTMMIIGPVMYVFFAFVSPAAIGVYFLVSTTWRVAQQYYITRSLYGHEDALGVQAQKAMAEVRESRKKEQGGTNAGGGGLFGGLLGNQPAKPAPRGGAAKGGSKPGGRANAKGGATRTSGKSTAAKSTPAKSTGKATTNGNGRTATPAKANANGNGAARGKAGTTPQATSAGASGAPKGQAHSRSKKKRKRK
jgi:YidC/Oxa1 family membrane protein insertase